MSTKLNRADLVGIVALAVLLIGMATGSAFAMLITSLAALALIVLLTPKQLGRGVILVVLVSAFVAVTATAITLVL